jgi:hypothetical protein
MNKFGKFLLVVTSLAPILLAYAVNAASKGDTQAAYYFLVCGIGFSVVCLLILWFCKTQISVESLVVTKVKSVDKQAIAFLIIYLMPLFADNAVDFRAHPWTATYVVLIIGVVVYHSNAFAFNPILALLQYHFYEVENDVGMTYLLVTRKLLRQQSNTIKVVEIADYVFMDKE